MTITEIIARLGHECRLPWARCYGEWAYRRHVEGAVCTKHRGHSGDCLDRHGNGATPVVAPLPPTLAEWQAEHEREHPGEPGPVASWTSEDGRVGWFVDAPTYVEIHVGRVSVVSSAIGWYAGYDCRNGTSADWAECVRLMQAADGGGT